MEEKNSIKFETLHKHVDINTILLIISLFVIVILVIINRVSHAAYTSSLDVPFVRGKINYKHPDFKVIGMYVQASSGSSTYNETNTMPIGNDYVINEDKSYCNKGFTEEKDDKIVLKTVDGNHVMNNLTKNDRCFLYFDVAPLNVAGILAKYTKDNSRSGEITANFTGSTPTTVYSKEDDDGTSYVFAGVNPNNWVKLGNLYFRIIRFNGDGSMRLIYSGEGSAQTSGTGTQIGTRAFNPTFNDNAYVGLQYTTGSVHGTGSNAPILGSSTSTDATTLYGWYNSKIKPSYASKIDTNAGFCSDRRSYIDINGNTSGGGTGTAQTYYRAYITYIKGNTYQTSFNPDLTCPTSSDKLTLPVGLITADEYMVAGGGSANSLSYYNKTFWLHTGQAYWTMSPCSYHPETRMFLVNSAGYLNYLNVSWIDPGVRPVINLKASTTFSSGNGTSSSPYIVKI